MQVPLRRAEVAMACEFLYRSRWRAAHREVRAQNVLPMIDFVVQPCS